MVRGAAQVRAPDDAHDRARAAHGARALAAPGQVQVALVQQRAQDLRTISTILNILGRKKLQARYRSRSCSSGLRICA